MDPNPTRPEDVAATFCATLVDEWARAGLTDAVVCPGSRSTPMALALHADPRVRVHVHHDERSGGFTGLGLGLATGRAAAVLTTSGTAAVGLHAAVVEAHQAGVPLLAVTANRPPELQGIGAPQTIDQAHLFGRAVRAFHAPGAADGVPRGSWRGIAARAYADTVTAPGGPGPVHLDLAFREPLVGAPGDRPDGRPNGRPWTTVARPATAVVAAEVRAVLGATRRGIVVAGTEPGIDQTGSEATAPAAATIAAALGWPLIVDARLRGGCAGTRAASDGARPSGAADPVGGGATRGAAEAVVVGAADAILRSPAAATALQPEVVLHVGAPVASRVVNEWIAASAAVEVRVDRFGNVDPARRAARCLPVTAAALARALADPAAPGASAGGSEQAGPPPDGGSRAGAPPTGGSGDGVDTAWVAGWWSAEAAAQEAIDEVLGVDPAVSEPMVARAVLSALPDGTSLVVSSSMPIRDLEWFGRPRGGVVVHANRGANGIDGVLATATGVALGVGVPTVVMLGDVAFLHDSSSLTGLARRGVDLTVVVVDNDGGGIFSFLPQAREPGGAVFEELFGTPHGVDLAVLAAAHGVDVVDPPAGDDLGAAVRASMDRGGVTLIRAVTDRSENVAVHHALHEAVADSVANVLPGPDTNGVRPRS